MYSVTNNVFLDIHLSRHNRAKPFFPFDYINVTKTKHSLDNDNKLYRLQEVSSLGKEKILMSLKL